MSDIIIKTNRISKIYHLYDNPKDRLKETLHPFRKKYHHDFYALKDINLEIKKGETVGIIGKNGAGKSTLLQILTGVLTPTSGEYFINGKVSSLLELGTGFNHELTGIENVYFHGTILGYSKKEMDEKIDNIIAFADIGEYMHQPVKTYSSGMYVRLAFAVAINVDPNILIVDEALAVGDMIFQQKCYRKFKQFQEKGVTILMVTHDISSIIRYCNTCIVIDQGVMKFNGDTKSAVDFYKRILVGYKEDKEDGNKKKRHEIQEILDQCKSEFEINPNRLEYGNNDVKIISYGMFDKNDKPVQKIANGDEFFIRMKVKFNKNVESPIFAYTIKDLAGMEITGTNTMFLKHDTGNYKKGDIVFIEFLQTINLKAGEYALSLGCTNYERDDFVVYHRLYDVLLFNVISAKEFVGFFDLKSRVSLSKIQ